MRNNIKKKRFLTIFLVFIIFSFIIFEFSPKKYFQFNSFNDRGQKNHFIIPITDLQDFFELDTNSYIWTQTQVVSIESSDSILDLSLFIDDSDILHLAWSDYTDYQGSGEDADYLYKSCNSTSGIWTPAEVISTESANRSHFGNIDVDKFGNINIAWCDITDYGGAGIDYDIFYKYKDANTGLWTITEVITSGAVNSSADPEIRSDNFGNLHMVWYDSTDYGGTGSDIDIFYKFRNHTTGTWSIIELVSTNTTENSMWPDMTLDEFGNVHVVWEEWNSSGLEYNIFYKMRNFTTGNWTKIEEVSTESSDFSEAPAISVDSSGNIHVVWRDKMDYMGAGIDEDIFYKQKYTNNNSWSAAVLVSDGCNKVSSSPEIFMGNDGKLHFVWRDDTEYNGAGGDCDIFYKCLDLNNNEWSTKEVVSTESTASSSYPKLAVDGLGVIHVVWLDGTNYNGSGADSDVFYKKKIKFTPQNNEDPDYSLPFYTTPPTYRFWPYLILMFIVLLIPLPFMIYKKYSSKSSQLIFDKTSPEQRTLFRSKLDSYPLYREELPFEQFEKTYEKDKVKHIDRKSIDYSIKVKKTETKKSLVPRSPRVSPLSSKLKRYSMYKEDVPFEKLKKAYLENKANDLDKKSIEESITDKKIKTEKPLISHSLEEQSSLILALKDENIFIRINAAKELGKFNDIKSSYVLINAFKNNIENKEVQNAVELSLIKIGETAVKPLLDLIKGLEISLLTSSFFRTDLLFFVFRVLKTIATNKVGKKAVDKIPFRDEHLYISRFHQLAHRARLFAEIIIGKSKNS